MKKIILSSLAPLLIFAAQAYASTETGNLTVTTTISAVCNVPSPNGNLVLPFSNSVSLIGAQSLSQDVVVSVTCTGNPTVSSVTFGDGLYATDALSGSKTAGSFRAMKRTTSIGIDSVKTNYLGYRLYASKSSGFAPSETVGNSQFTTASATPGDYTLTLGDTGASTFYIKGRVYEADLSRAWASAATVTGGTYNDTVVMTISY